jgi:ribosomal protein S18 acetylase RimI-like enzyme
MLTKPFDRSYSRAEFDCGNTVLNRYLKQLVSQDMKRKLTTCYVVEDDNRILGFYTLSNISIIIDELLALLTKGIPNSYKEIPATLLGRLAIDNSMKGKGLGKEMVADAMFRVYMVSKEVASFGLVTDPKDDIASTFYENIGFEKLIDRERLFISMKTIEKAINT